MSGSVQVDFGGTGIRLSLPAGIPVVIAEPRRDPPLADPEDAVREALRCPVGTPALRDLARGKRKAAVVVSDITRPVPYGVVLPPLLDELHAAGIGPAQVEIVVATGLHRANTTAELEAMLGASIVSHYAVRNHVARDLAQHEFLGETTRGTPIWIDRGFLAADLRILTGLIEPHLMAGYSGGRKALCPGLAGVPTMRHAHGATMLDSHVGPGILDGNPFHEDLLEIVRRVGVDFLCDVTIDRARQLTGVFAGDVVEAHLRGVGSIERQVHVALDRQVDVVVSSAGGAPLDRTFYQAIKGLVAGLNIVRPGGTIALVAELGEGIGSAEFTALLASVRSPAEFRQRLADPTFFQVDQWMVQHLCQVLERARVVVVSPAPKPPLGEGFDIEWVSSWEEAAPLLVERHGRAARWAVLPEGPYTLATVRGQKHPLHLRAA